jgi:predicted translin family RNA/ssDNA-binding protein
MVKLELTDEEQALLLEELKDRLGTIREEIYHSNTYEFTSELKRKQAVLRNLIEKIETCIPQPDVSA